MRKIEKDTGSTPQALIDKPQIVRAGTGIAVGRFDVVVGLDPVKLLNAYEILDRSRHHDEVGPQAIQVGEIKAYLDIARIDAVEDRLLFLNTIKLLDVIYLNHYAEHKK